jgi:hypothetical protein
MKTTPILGLFWGSLLLSGCGGKEEGPTTYPVSGVVVYRDGTPYRGGMVELATPDGKQRAVGRIGPDGRFALSTPGEKANRPGAVPGNYRVIIHPDLGQRQGGVAIRLPNVLKIHPEDNPNVTLTIDRPRGQERGKEVPKK